MVRRSRKFSTERPEKFCSIVPSNQIFLETFANGKKPLSPVMLADGIYWSVDKIWHRPINLFSSLWSFSFARLNRQTGLKLVEEPDLVSNIVKGNLRKETTFRDATSAFPSKWRLREQCRNSWEIPSYWWRVTTQIWILFLIVRAACEICVKSNLQRLKC